MITTATHTDVLLATLTRFFDQAGIRWAEEPVEGQTFMPGITIRSGVLTFDRSKLLYPGDLLHEAGHIALTHPATRDQLNGDVTAGDVNKEGEEIAVLLWSYLAARACKIAPEVVFHEHGYKGQGDWLIENYTEGTWIGAPLLQWMGIIGKAEKGVVPEVRNWLRIPLPN